MKLIQKLIKNRKSIFGISGVIGVLFLSFFLYLLGQVNSAFETPTEFIPTRIYSNVTRIAAPLARGSVEQKLKALGYNTKAAENGISFTLHSPEYPDYLLPPDHPTLTLKDKLITLRFDGESPDSRLSGIVSGGAEINDIYLEPEFVATLSSEKSQIREVLKFDEFPKAIPDAVMAAEDNRFYDHFGIDPRGFLRAVFVNLKTLSFSQGGSTITQQLVKNLMERRNRNLFMKINELFLAPVLEFKYTKQQIFERYLNEVFLGQIGAYEVRGFAEGAKYFFGKKVNDLNSGEIALLVGLIKGPAFYSPYKHYERAVIRQRYVLQRMLETGKINDSEFKKALGHPIRLSQAPQAGNRAPYFVDYVKAELVRLLKDRFEEDEIPELGFQVYTTLDLGMNQIAQESLQKGLDGIENRLGIKGIFELQGAVAAVDQSSGEIRTLIGGRNYSQSTFNRVLNMKRQAGSTFKPIVYATAFRQIKDSNGNAFTPAYPIQDEKWRWKYNSKQPAWSPSNYEGERLGWISLKTALTRSINTTSARIAKRVGLAEIAETARVIGLESTVPEVPSVALGSLELSPIETLRAYMTFANHGSSDTPMVIKSILNPDGSDFFRNEYRPKPRLDPGIADMMTYLLQGVFEDGTARSAGALGFDRPAAGKTGTTNDYRDAWFVGYTPQLTALVWVGLDQGIMDTSKVKKKIHLTGAVAALPIWIELMKRSLQYEPELPFPESEHLVEMRLDIRSGQKAESSCPESQVVLEKVIAGREPEKSTCLSDFPKDID
ncbi:MAG: PBP1A family penicillin-binding protein [Bdellovibrionales bacterium]|nr:PBP1A family penicillin-binding protein [Bdellovibrionales bacterium]